MTYYRICNKCDMPLPIGEVADSHECKIGDIELRIKALEKEVFRKKYPQYKEAQDE